MADISALGNLLEATPLDMDTYDLKEPSTFRMPAKGRYTLRAPESFPAEAFGATNAGYLSARIDPTIVGGEHDGYTIKYQKVSAKPFSNAPNVSQIGNYLRACGVTGTIPGNPQALADAVEATANLTFEASLDWRAFDKVKQVAVDGMENFPKDHNGAPQPWLDSVDADGNPTRVWANLQITRFYPKK